MKLSNYFAKVVTFHLKKKITREFSVIEGLVGAVGVVSRIEFKGLHGNPIYNYVVCTTLPVMCSFNVSLVRNGRKEGSCIKERDVDMRTIKLVSPEEALIWKIEHHF